MDRNVAFDLGTSNSRIYIPGKGVVLNEPSVVVVDKLSNRIVKFGRDAQSIIGRAPDEYEVVFPLEDGVISRYRHAMLMMQRMIRKAIGRTLIKPSITVAVPSIITDVEEHAVRDAAIEAGAREAFLIDKPLASAIGAGKDITKAKGVMVVDIGGGTADTAVIALGGVVVYDSVKTAGGAMDRAIVRYIRKKHGVIVGRSAAEEAKIKAGAVWRREDDRVITVKGKNVNRGTPDVVSMTSYDMITALEEPMTAIIESVCRVIEKTPPELISDIAEDGIILTGGACQLYGLDKLIYNVTGIPARVAQTPMSCCVIGAGRAADAGITPSYGRAAERRKKYF